MEVDSCNLGRDFLDFAFHFNNISLLVKRAAVLLKNPVAIFDENYYTVAYSDADGIEDTVWLGGKERGYCLYEYAAMLHGLDKQRGYPSPHQIFDDFGPHRRRISPLISNSVTIGYLTVLEYFTDLDQISEDTYELVIGVSTKELAVEQALKQSHQHDSTESLLVSLLNAGFANRMLFMQRVLGTAFEKESTYFLISIDMKSFHSKNTGEGHFKSLIGSLFSRGWSVFHRQYVVLLVDCGKSGQLAERGIEMLQTYLTEYSLFSGMSDPFSDLYEIRQFYEQAVTAEKLARQLGDFALVAKYDDYKLLDMASSISSEKREKLLSICLQQLRKSDQDNNTEYISTLFSYLKNGQSLALTAEELHIHRNTVVYRMEKIKQRFGMNFDSPYYNLQNYMGCLLLRLLQ